MATKAQVAKRFKDAGIVQPKVKLEGEALQAMLRQRSNTFASGKTKDRRCRATARRMAIAAY